MTTVVSVVGPEGEVEEVFAKAKAALESAGYKTQNIGANTFSCWKDGSDFNPKADYNEGPGTTESSGDGGSGE